MAHNAYETWAKKALYYNSAALIPHHTHIGSRTELHVNPYLLRPQWEVEIEITETVPAQAGGSQTFCVVLEEAVL